MKTLILNKRHELPRTKRLVWDSVTILLWFGFFYMWTPVLHIFYRIVTLNAPPDELSDWIYDKIYSVTVEHALYMLIGTPIILFILSRLNRHQAQSEHLLYESSDYANYFNLSDTQLQECVNSQLVTVHFDEHGHIIYLDNQIANNDGVIQIKS